MPLVRFGAVRGRSEAEVKNLLDAAHRAVAGRKPQIERVGFAYMFGGAWVPNRSIMMRGPAWKSWPLAVPVSPVLYLVMPIREWSRK
jgi:hypothetical protein